MYGRRILERLKCVNKRLLRVILDVLEVMRYVLRRSHREKPYTLNTKRSLHRVVLLGMGNDSRRAETPVDMRLRIKRIEASRLGSTFTPRKSLNCGSSFLRVVTPNDSKAMREMDLCGAYGDESH